MKTIIDLGFGDSGKGLSVSFVASKCENPLITRFNSGPQCGHTVRYNGRKHVFSQLGSGTLQGFDTYFDKQCVFYPPSFLREYKLLEDLSPKLFLHPMCRITTPFDIDYNRYKEDNVERHGSVGMGFGQTIQRNEEFYSLFAQDLLFPKVLKAKLDNIIKYYARKGINPDKLEEDKEYFLESVRRVLPIIQIKKMRWWENDNNYDDQIFEAGQGILLDMHHGFFPNVTRSSTTYRNIKEGGHIFSSADEIFYVTRCYQTRHGNGYMSNEDKPIPVLKNNEEETNVSHKYQGHFRITELDTELLRYSLRCDSFYSYDIKKKNLIITCNDQLEIDIDNVINELEKEVKFSEIYLSFGPSLTDIKQYR